jgi:hypothetical protein
VTCLLASFRLLDETYQDRIRQILKGLFAFQLYASEFWTEYVLRMAHSTHGIHTESPLYTILSEFTERLELMSQGRTDQPMVSGPVLDKRLSGLEPHSIIHKQVQLDLWARSLDQLEEQVKLEHSNSISSSTHIC